MTAPYSGQETDSPPRAQKDHLPAVADGDLGAAPVEDLPRHGGDLLGHARPRRQPGLLGMMRR